MLRSRSLLLLAVAVVGAFSAGRVLEAQSASEKPSTRVFEIRTYTTNEGKLGDLHARFRDHTTKLFEKHGMTNIGYWVPMDDERSQNTLIYIIAHDSRDAAKESWANFQKDPQWQRARNASEENGKILAKVESIYVSPTDYSAMK